MQATFRALADPTRRAIIDQLAQGPKTVGEVAGRFSMTRAAVKKHLIVLEEGQLVIVERRGRERINHLQPHALKPVSDWLNHFSQFWDQRLTALEKAIEDEECNNG